MGIKANLSAGVQQLGASAADVVIHNIAFRTAVTAASVYNTLGINVGLTVYESPDDTSAAGEPVAQHTLGPVGGQDDSIDLIEVIGQGYAANTRLIVVVNTAGVVLGDLLSKLTYTQYTGDS